MNTIEIIFAVIIVFLLVRNYMPIIVTFKKVNPSAKRPTKAYHKAACYDIYSIEDVTIASGKWGEVDSGIAFAPWPHIYIPFLRLTITPFGNVAYKIHSRSGLAINRGIKNHLGIIDNDYREKITAIAFNLGPHPHRYKPGHKIAQIEFYRVPTVILWERKNLSKSFRGKKGLGSTGA